jgi:Trk K+ transport system NAD-binding subunit
MPGKKAISFKQKFRYKFDNIMSAGTIAIIGWLFILSLILIVIGGAVVAFAAMEQDTGQTWDFMEATWQSVMRVVDTGNVANDTGWALRPTMLIVTLGGLFSVSILIGVVSNGIGTKLDQLRKGRSFVVESGHTLILGWSEKIFPIINELVIANENQKNPRIVILSQIDKVKMEDEIKRKIPGTKNTKIICRNGNPMDLDDIEIVNPHNAKSIIVLAPEDTHEPDIDVIKTILALTKNPKRKDDSYHIVAEMSHPENKEVAEMIGKDELVILNSEDLIARLIAQTCRQSGLSVVYTDLLQYEGSEIYFRDEPGLAGKSFKESIHSYEDSAAIGIRFKDGHININPPMDTKIQPRDKIIAISEDDDTVILNGKPEGIDLQAISHAPPVPAPAEHTLLLGWNRRGLAIIRELDNYLANGSTVTIVADHGKADKELNEILPSIKNQTITFRSANTTDRKILESLELEKYNHIILLCYTDSLDAQDADAHTLITLLHLRNIAEKNNCHYSIVTEMLDIKNKELAAVTKADDFIISNKLISLMLAQLSENKKLKEVFDDLFSAKGSEIYLKPALIYVKPGTPVDFYTVAESAAAKNEVAIGYRIAELAFDASKAYGVVVNPAKSKMITFTDKDKIVVLAED